MLELERYIGILHCVFLLQFSRYGTHSKLSFAFFPYKSIYGNRGIFQISLRK